MNGYATPFGAVSLKLPATPKAVRAGRLLVSCAMRFWGLNDLAYDAAVIVSELLTNAVKAGPGPVRDPDGTTLVAVQARVQAKSLVLEVWDGSPKMPQARVLDDTAEGGRGLPLVGMITDHWNVWQPGTGGKVVYAEIDLTDPPAVSLEGAPLQLPPEVLDAGLTGTGSQHLMADTALMMRFMNGLAAC